MFLQERSLTSLQSSLDSMKTTAQSLNEELGTDLLAQLSVDDQREVDKLNDQIQTLTVENRQTLKERVRVNSYATCLWGGNRSVTDIEIINVMKSIFFNMENKADTEVERQVKLH